MGSFVSKSILAVCALVFATSSMADERRPGPPRDDEPTIFVGDLLCPEGQLLRGIDSFGQKVCVDVTASIRAVGGVIIDSFHNIAAATCNADEFVAGGRCQCHGAGTWIAGTVGNSYQCACTANPTHVSAVAICQKKLR